MPEKETDWTKIYDEKMANQESIMLNAAELAFNTLYPDATDGVQRRTGNIGQDGTFFAFAISKKGKRVKMGKAMKLPEPQSL